MMTAPKKSLQYLGDCDEFISRKSTLQIRHHPDGDARSMNMNVRAVSMSSPIARRSPKPRRPRSK
jgi:hypothetical protein